MMLKQLNHKIVRMYMDEDGATMVEYAMMAAFIAAVCALTVGSVGIKTNGLFARAESNFP